MDVQLLGIQGCSAPIFNWPESQGGLSFCLVSEEECPVDAQFPRKCVDSIMKLDQKSKVNRALPHIKQEQKQNNEKGGKNPFRRTCRFYRLAEQPSPLGLRSRWHFQTAAQATTLILTFGLASFMILLTFLTFGLVS